jgi:hypothetical protein
VARPPGKQRPCFQCGEPATVVLKAQPKERLPSSRSTSGRRSWATCAKHVSHAAAVRHEECGLERYSYSAVAVGNLSGLQEHDDDT